MSMIQVRNLTFGYDNSLEKVFENVSFNLDTDWKLGLIGRNGKGKTTLLKLLLNRYKYEGQIIKNVEVDYFPFEIKNKERMAMEIVQEIASNAEDWEIIKELNLLNAEPEILYKNFDVLSGGEQVKILLISLFLKDHNFLLIDEPTNHLDIETKGNFSSWQENKLNQDNFEIKQNEKLKKDINRLEVAAKNTSNWSNKVESTKIGTKNSGLRPDTGYIGHQAAKMMKKSKVMENRIEKAITEKTSLLKNIDRNEELTIKPLESRKSPIILAENLQVQYDEKQIFDKVSFNIENGERLAIIGKNGVGKSSILKLILGEDIKFEGNLKIANDLKISYVSQNTEYLNGTLKEFARENKIDEGIFKAMLAKMGVLSTEFEKDMQYFSEGQKKKILIAKSITELANIYIWDEPLNYIDILTRVQIEDAILKYKPTMIFIEHDKTFVRNIATKIVELTKI